VTHTGKRISLDSRTPFMSIVRLWAYHLEGKRY